MITMANLTFGQKQYIGPHLHKATILARKAKDPEISRVPYEICMLIPKRGQGKKINPGRVQELVERGWQTVHEPPDVRLEA